MMMLYRYVLPAVSCDAGRLRTILKATVVALVVTLGFCPDSADAAGKEYWHDLRHDYVSIDYVFGWQSDNPGIRIRAPDQALTSREPAYRLTYGDVAYGWRFQLTFDFFDWIGAHFSGIRTERKLELRNLVYTTVATAPGAQTTRRQVAFGTERFHGDLTSTTVNYGLVFHTPGEIFSFDAGAAYSRVKFDYDLRGTDLRLSNVAPNSLPDDERIGWVGWLGVRFRLGDRWETDFRFHQSLYNDRYDEYSMGEGSLAFSPAPKTELRLTAWYDLNSQFLRGDVGVRFYF